VRAEHGGGGADLLGGNAAVHGELDDISLQGGMTARRRRRCPASRRRPRRASTRGRGLAIVAALSAAWGSERTGGGQVTWCQIHASDTTAA